jgi:hypothetical protein
VTIPSNKTYNEILDTDYETFETDTSYLLAKEFAYLHHTPFLTLEHDLWSNSAKNGIAGASCGFIDHQWRPCKLAHLAKVKKNDGHDGEDVAGLLDEELKQRYRLDVKKWLDLPS